MNDKSNSEQNSVEVASMLEKRNQQSLQELGEQVRKARLEKEMSQARLAQLMDRRQAYISELEHGKVDPTATTLLTLCFVLDRRISYFFPSDWSYSNRETLDAGKLSHDEMALVEKLRQLERGFQHHLALRIINTIADVSQEEEDFRNTLEDTL